jgi:hypothetical protein
MQSPLVPARQVTALLVECVIEFWVVPELSSVPEVRFRCFIRENSGSLDPAYPQYRVLAEPGRGRVRSPFEYGDRSRL